MERPGWTFKIQALLPESWWGPMRSVSALTSNPSLHILLTPFAPSFCSLNNLLAPLTGHYAYLFCLQMITSLAESKLGNQCISILSPVSASRFSLVCSYTFASVYTDHSRMWVCMGQCWSLLETWERLPGVLSPENTGWFVVWSSQVVTFHSGRSMLGLQPVV